MSEIEFLEIESKVVWDNFFNFAGSPSFHHSWEWGQLQRQLGQKVRYLGLYEASELKVIVLAVFNIAKRGSFLLVPHGPILSIDCHNNLELIKKYLIIIRDHLSSLAREQNCSFVRLATIFADTPEYKSLFRDLGFVKAPIYIHSERMWTLDLSVGEDELLQNMRKTTRYLIKKAEKDGVTIQNKNDYRSLDIFWELYLETAQRERFKVFSKDFIYKEFEAFEDSKSVDIFTGYYQDRPMASAIIYYTDSTAFYHQGASIHSKIPVSYLLQWRAIQQAKQRGCRYYSFHGILKEGRTPRAWRGLTLFKKGFGGFQVDYLPTMDYVLDFKYYLTWVYEKYLMWRRGAY